MLNVGQTPPDRRNAAFVRYATGCNHRADFRCEQDESVAWHLDQLVAVNPEFQEQNSQDASTPRPASSCSASQGRYALSEEPQPFAGPFTFGPNQYNFCHRPEVEIRWLRGWAWARHAWPSASTSTPSGRPAGKSRARAPPRSDSDARPSALRTQHREARKRRKHVGKCGRHPTLEIPTEDETKSFCVFAPPPAATYSFKRPAPRSGGNAESQFNVGAFGPIRVGPRSSKALKTVFQLKMAVLLQSQ